jgi:hypothetical protein
MLAACGAGEFGEAVTEAGKTATGSARQDPALHLQCHALQQALQQVQLAGGPTVLVPGVSPGLLASSAGGGQANRGVSSRLQGVADRLQKLAGRGGVTVSVTRAVRRLAGEETEYVDLVTTTQEGGLNDRQRAFLGRLREQGHDFRFLEVRGRGHAEEVQFNTINRYKEYGWQPAALGSSTNICGRCFRRANDWLWPEIVGQEYGPSPGRLPYREIIWPYLG